MRVRLVLFFLFCFCISYAGNKKNKVDNAAVDSVVSANDTIIQRQSMNTDSILSALQTLVKDDSIQIKVLNDSIKILQTNLSKAQRLIEERERMLLFDDSCLVALAYRRTLEPYDETRVMRALSYYDKIFSPSLKKERADVFDALRDYKPAYLEVMSILEKAQNDFDRAGNPFRVAEYQKQYTKELQNSLYYQKYLMRKQSVSLPILERLINEALDRLSRHSDIKPADFSDLL